MKEKTNQTKKKEKFNKTQALHKGKDLEHVTRIKGKKEVPEKSRSVGKKETISKQRERG